MVTYIPEICPYKDNCTECVTNQINSDIRYVCAYPFHEGTIEIVKRWNENIKNIPQKDEYMLDGIDHWHVHRFEMIPDMSDIECGKCNKEFRDEADKLISAGFDIGFNTDHGVGHIKIEDREKKKGFIVELWQNQFKTEIIKDTLDEVLDWVIYFHCNNKNL